MGLPSDLRDKINELIGQGAGGQIVALSQKLMNILTDAGYVRHQVLLPDQVTVHPSNRDGVGLLVTDVHDLVEDIVETGWSDSKCYGIAVDTGIRHQATNEFNRRLAESSMGLLPHPDETQARYASLAGSHTVAGMRCVLHGAPHNHKGSKLTVDGCFNINLVEKADMGYANACRHGFTWAVISNDIITEFPAVADLLQAGQNTNVFKKESEFQILKRMITWIGQKAQVSWNEVKKSILKTKPDCSDACPYMFQFLTKFMNRDDLNKTDKRVMQTLAASKALGTDFWQAVSKDGKTAGEVLLTLRHCAVSAAYCSGTSLTGADVRKMLGNTAKSGKSQDLIEELRSLMDKTLNDEQKLKSREIQQQFEDRMVLVAMDKRPKHADAFTMVPETHFQVAVDSIKDETELTLTTKYEAYRPEPAPSPRSAAAGSTDKHMDQQVSSHG